MTHKVGIKHSLWRAGSIMFLILVVVAVAFAVQADDNSLAGSPANLKPRLQIVGNGRVCNLRTSETFRFKGSGFFPGDRVYLVIAYPNNEMYTNLVPPAYYEVNSRGNFSAKNKWDCREGVGNTNTQDPVGVYMVRAVGMKAGDLSQVATFRTITGQ